MVGVWYQRKLHGTREARNGGKVKECVLSMDSTLIKRTDILVAKILKSSKTKVLRACS